MPQELKGSWIMVPIAVGLSAFLFGIEVRLSLSRAHFLADATLVRHSRRRTPRRFAWSKQTIYVYIYIDRWYGPVRGIPSVR